MVTVVRRRAGSWVGKMSRALMFVGLWVILGSLAEKSRKKKCAGIFHVKIYVCHIESVPKVVGVLIPIKFIYFLRTELVSDNVFAKIVSEGWSRIFKIQISAAYF